MANDQIMFDGPQPPAGCKWCAVCAMLYKQSGLERLSQQMDIARANGSRVNLASGAALAKTELKVAVTRALSTVQPAWGPMDVCWSHALGLRLQGGGIAPATPADAAMLSGGRLLGQ